MVVFGDVACVVWLWWVVWLRLCVVWKVVGGDTWDVCVVWGWCEVRLGVELRGDVVGGGCCSFVCRVVWLAVGAVAWGICMG